MNVIVCVCVCVHVCMCITAISVCLVCLYVCEFSAQVLIMHGTIYYNVCNNTVLSRALFLKDSALIIIP